jgi:hypothetical protein
VLEGRKRRQENELQSKPTSAKRAFITLLAMLGQTFINEGMIANGRSNLGCGYLLKK